ncbi:MAG: BACON domain-containing protein [Candidatus Contendobacter sp.]|nr:BACON domain-containing protein [Candidatus Contendobacter sp.]
MAFNYSGLAAGSHTFTVRAYDNAGGARDVNATISVVRFVNSYMVDPVAVNMDSATITQGGNAITVQNLLAEGQPYTVQLNWRPATQGFAITQINSASGGGGGGGGCSYTINPTSQQFSAQDGSGDVTVTTQPGCSWTAKNNVNWIAIASGANETGSGTVKYLVSSNSGVVLRIGTLTIAGQKFTVYQNHYQDSSGGGQ